MTRGKAITRDDLHRLINSVELPDDARDRLLQLTPQTYIGNADKQAKEI
jgi:adenylosuccinate lyase